MTVKTLNDRVLEAKVMATLSRITNRRTDGRATVVIVPGSQASQNQVIIRRLPGGVVTCECRKCQGKNGMAVCKGNLSGFCRHSLAAIWLAMEDRGYIPRFRTSLPAAKKLAIKWQKYALEHEGEPVVITLQSHQNSNAKKLYMVALDATAMELNNVR